jgi:two-component system, NtrC family, sensor kinase
MGTPRALTRLTGVLAHRPPIWPGLSVRGKLILSSLVLLLVVSFAFTAASLWLANRWVEDELRGRAIAFAREVAASIGDQRELENTQLLRSEIKRIMEARQTVRNIDILALGHSLPRLLVSTDPTWRPPLTLAQQRELAGGRVVARLVEEQEGRFWEVVAPIVLEGHVAGAVAVEFSLAQADRQTARVRWTSLAITGGSVLVAVFLMGLVVRRVVDRPIRQMLAVIDRVERGDRSAGLALPPVDEFGQLAAHFNRMLERLNQASAQQEGRVREATAELGRRYDELRRLNELLFQTQRRLRHSERLAVMGRTLGLVAHEVGTPLHSVAGHIELLRQELAVDVLEGSAGRRLAVVHSQLLRVTETIEQLLRMTQPPTGDRVPVDLNDVLRDVLDLVSPAVGTGRVRVDSAFARDLPPVAGDANHLQQALLNVVANALDAMAGDGVLGVTTTAERRNGATWAVVRVRDTGPGIPPEHRKQIFEPFFTTKELGKGSGLGLFITRQIVREHGGLLDVESEPGQGTAFVLAFPPDHPPSAT